MIVSIPDICILTYFLFSRTSAAIWGLTDLFVALKASGLTLPSSLTCLLSLTISMKFSHDRLYISGSWVFFPSILWIRSKIILLVSNRPYLAILNRKL